MAARGLKTKIAVNIAILLLASAILTGAVILLITQAVMVRAYLAQQQKTLTGLWPLAIQSVDPKIAGGNIHLPQSTATALLGQLDIPAALWMDAAGRTCLTHGAPDEQIQLLGQMATQTIHDGKPHRRYVGRTWAVIWWHAETAVVCEPVIEGGIVVGAGAGVVPLGPIITRLRNFNLPMVLYIIFNSAVLTLIGIFRIFRIYLRPIERMVSQAESYGDEEDFFFSFRREDNELNRLSKSLNRMLGRIAGDRQKLQESVASLAKANTDLKVAQNEIVQAEKMASIGRLAAGVAHEIGNPIGIVLGYLDLLKQSDFDVAEREDFLNRSEIEIQRINTIIRQLLDLSRPRQSRPRDISAHAIIEDFLITIGSQPMVRGIKLQQDLSAEMDNIHCDGDQLRQVLLNIVINAADAIHDATQGDTGEITITTVNENNHGPSPANWIKIAIRDNGSGIKPEQLPNIFDPFFTTKEPGKGTGLGLAVSYTIIEKMGGSLSAQSTPDHGTIFTLKLPLSPANRQNKGDHNGKSLNEPT